MITIKQLHRPSYGWANSTSKKDKFFINGVAVPPHVPPGSFVTHGALSRTLTAGFMCWGVSDGQGYMYKVSEHL